MTCFHIDLLLKFYCLFEKTKINEKEAGVGPFKKKIDINNSRTIFEAVPGARFFVYIWSFSNIEPGLWVKADCG